MGYLANFIVYTLAMVGVIVVALLAFKKCSFGNQKSSANHLRIIDTMSLGPRKTLYIISAGKEKFLIAGDAERTSLISRLDTEKKNDSCASSENLDLLFNSSEKTQTSFKETMTNLNNKTRYADKSIIGIQSSQKSPYTSVMRSLADRIKE